MVLHLAPRQGHAASSSTVPHLGFGSIIIAPYFWTGLPTTSPSSDAQVVKGLLSFVVPRWGMRVSSAPYDRPVSSHWRVFFLALSALMTYLVLTHWIRALRKRPSALEGMSPCFFENPTSRSRPR